MNSRAGRSCHAMGYEIIDKTIGENFTDAGNSVASRSAKVRV